MIYSLPIHSPYLTMNSQTLKINKLDTSKLTTKKSNYAGQQDSYYVSHAGSNPVWKTDRFELLGGIPDFTPEELVETKGEMAITKDSQREYLRIGLDPAQPELVELRAFVEKLQDWSQSEAGLRSIFGKQYKMYSMGKIFDPVPPPQKGDDGKPLVDDNGDPVPWPEDKVYIPKIKMHLDCRGGTKKASDSRPLHTCVVRREDGKRYEEEGTNTVAKLAERVFYKSRIRIAFKIARIWASKEADKDLRKYKCGIILKAQLIEYEPNLNRGGKLTAADIDFDDSEDEELVVEADTERVQNKAGLVSVDSVPAGLKPKKDRRSKKPARVEESSSEEEELVRASRAQPVAMPDLDTDSEGEEPPARKSSKKVNRSKKKARREDTESEENESTPPPSPKKKREKKKARQVSEEDEATPPPSPKKSRAVESSSEDEATPPPSPKKKREKRRPSPKKSSKKSSKKTIELSSSEEE